jgi:phosphoribosylformylglycinamidine cyclo-ligase
MTYRDAGVDVGKVRAAQKSIGEIISATHKLLATGKVVSGFGHYAGLIKLGSQLLALHSDGVGTKVLVAQLMNKFDTIGVDCVAMNVNDVICVGAQPVGFIDYVALRQPNERLLEEIAKGLVEGAKQSQMAIVGGETAILPDVIAGEENAFDLAGMVMGVVKGKPILGDSIRPGDIILGVESSGLHSNGYTLARKVLLSKYSVDDNADHMVQTVGEELLVPTRIYVRPVMEILKKKKIAVHGLANITGGSFTKLPRLNTKVRYDLDGLPEPTGIFKQIQVDGEIDSKEMYRTFNMGVGFCVVAPKASAEDIVSVFAKYKMSCKTIGKIEKGRGEVAAWIDGKKEAL